MVYQQTRPYISRSESKEFLTTLAQALEQPNNYPSVFHVSGIGGIGKTTLTLKLSESLVDRANLAKITFGRTEGIDQPIELMKQVYAQISPYDAWQRDPFWECCDRYIETVEKLKSQPIDKNGSVDETQANHVKTLLRLVVDTLGKAFLSERQEQLAEQVVERGTEAAIAGLSLKDDVESFLQRHPATKRKATLRELLLKPLLLHTQAFVKGLTQLAQKRPIVLVFDTYEKVPTFIDIWMWRTLLGNTDLMQQPIRLAIAGRHNLRREVGWNTLHQDTDCIYELMFKRFTFEQTRSYLTQIDIADEHDIQSIYQITKGLPYYLNWVREQNIQGQTPNFVEGRYEIEQILLRWLSPTQQKLVQFAACCRQFDSSLIRFLTEQNGLDFATAVDDSLNCFGWLIRQTFVEPAGQVWQVDDVARDVFRTGLQRADPEQFERIYQQLADYALHCADKEVSPEATPPDKYENPVWRDRYAEYLYYLSFNNHPDFQTLFLSHLLEARFFGRDESLQTVVQAMLAEGALEDEYVYLTFSLRQFLKAVEPAVSHGWAVLEEIPIDYPYNQEEYGLSKAATDTAIQHCLSHPAQFDGLAKFMALLCKAKRCSKTQQIDWLLRAQTQAETLRSIDSPDFIVNLFIYELGRAFHQANLYEQTIACYDVVLLVKPDFQDLYSIKALLLIESGRLEEALSTFDDALSANPNDYKTLTFKGGVLFAIGVSENDIPILDYVLNPDNHEVPHIEDDLLKDLLKELGRLEEALSAFDDALAIEPDHYEALYFKGSLLLMLGRLDEALAAYNETLSINPDSPNVLRSKGDILGQVKRLDEALAAYNETLSINPDSPDVLRSKGDILGQLERLDEALAAYNEALAIEPEDYNVLRSKGDMLRQLERLDEALAAYNEALAIEPEDYYALHNKGAVLQSLERYEEAIAAYDDVLRIKPDVHIALSSKGGALCGLGRYGEAIAVCNEALRIEPNDHGAIYNKACCCSLQRDISKALDFLQQAIALDVGKRDMARTDTDFDNIRQNPHFQMLVDADAIEIIDTLERSN